MGKTLTIVVAHYKEPWEVCKFLFDSIEIQHGIKFEDIEVLVVNDGDEVVLDKALFDRYSYDIRYEIKPHGGISDTRNYGIDHAEGDYIMFCDCDDGFLNNYGLHLVLAATEEGFDMLSSSFVEEQPVGNGWKIYRRDKDYVFIHGKAYRRQFLIDKKIRFDPGQYFSEDSLFNKIAYHEAGERIKEISTPFYLWTWHGESTVRKGREDIVLREYAQVVRMKTLACKQLQERGFIDEFFDSVCKTFFDAYYDFQSPLFNKPEYKDRVKAAEREVKKFYKAHIKDFYECDSERIRRAMMGSRTMSYTNNGLIMETTDFKTWLKHIKNDVK